MKKTVLILLAVTTYSISALAGTWRVNNVDASANFPNLDAAMAGITAGDTLYLEGSATAYTLSNAITKKVTIIGPGYFLTENPNTLENKSHAYISSDVKIMADAVTLEGIALYKTGNNSMLYIGSNNVTIRRCYLWEIHFTDQNNSTSIPIKNTIVTQCYMTGRFWSPSTDYPYNAIVSNNIFSNNLSYLRFFENSIIENNTCTNGYSITGNENCSIRNNICSSISTSSNINCTIENNYTTGAGEYLSSTSTDGKWILTETSAARTAGVDGTQCGAFGGATPYVLSGLPSVPHIYEIIAPTAASAASGLNVSIKIKTEN